MGALNFNFNYASGFLDGDGSAHLATKFDRGFEEGMRRKTDAALDSAESDQ